MILLLDLFPINNVILQLSYHEVESVSLPLNRAGFMTRGLLQAIDKQKKWSFVCSEHRLQPSFVCPFFLLKTHPPAMWRSLGWNAENQTSYRAETTWLRTPQINQLPEDPETDLKNHPTLPAWLANPQTAMSSINGGCFSQYVGDRTQ